jgi:hypothetical protein
MSVAVNAGRTADVNYYASQLNQENEGIWAQWDSAWKTWSKRTVDSMSEIANHTHALKGNKEWTIGNSYNAIINSAVYSHANYNRCPIRSQRWHYPYLNWWENTVL